MRGYDAELTVVSLVRLGLAYCMRAIFAASVEIRQHGTEGWA